MKYFEDFQVGESKQLGERLMSREDIIEFALKFDRQAIHIDEVAAKKTIFKGLIASGLHTLSTAASIVVDEYLQDTAMVGGAGMNNVLWVKPVRPGDHIAVKIEVVRKTPHPKTSILGVVTTQQTVTTDDGSVVMTGEVDYLFGRQPA
jgi:acyl dehydratase